MSDVIDKLARATEPKPCPFCGAKPYIPYSDDLSVCGPIHCSTRGCPASNVHTVRSLTWEVDEAIENWNRRAPAAQPKEGE